MKTNKELNKISQYLCLLLRHKPEICNLDMNTEGFVPVRQLIKALSTDSKNNISLDELKKIVSDDTKKRYSFKDHESYIRCNQGHSLSFVNIKYQTYYPTDTLYHGTAPHLKDVILKEGLKPQGRNHVHLSKNIETAMIVGKRHSKDKDPIIFTIDKDSDMTFFISENDIVLADEVLPQFLSVVC